MDARSLITSAVTMFIIALFLSLSRIAREARRTGSPGGFELRYSGIVRGLGAALSAVSVCFTIFAFVTTREPGTLTLGPWHMRYVSGGPWLAVATLPVALGGIVLLVESFTVFRMDSDGVVRQRIFGQPASLRWSDVSRVSADDHERPSE